MVSKNIISGGLLALASGMNLAIGLDPLFEHYSAINSIRDAVYAHADKITPGVIEQANELVSNFGNNP